MRFCPNRPANLAAAALLVTLVAFAAGCKGKPEPVAAEAKRFRPADDPALAATSAQAAAAEAPVTAASTDKPTAAGEPNADLQATLEQLDRLALQQPKGNNRQEYTEDAVRIHSQRLALARKALTMNPSAEMKPRIVMAMYEIHQVFVGLGLPSAMKQLTDFANTMSADADPEIARIGRHATFTANLTRIVSQPVENGKEIVAEAKKLLASEPEAISNDTEDTVVQTAQMLTGMGHSADAADLMESLAKALESTPGQTERAAQYAANAQIVRADLTKTLYDALGGDAAAKDKLVAQVKQLLASIPPGRTLLNEIFGVAHNLEVAGHFEAAQQCFDALTAAFKNVDQPELLETKELADKARQRMALVGQPLAVEGVLPDGQPFDWKAYEGKVVLVDFWASWCTPCIEEMPNIKQNFEQFHAKGFEVVGVNLNTNPADLKQFLTLQDLPWATVTTQEVLDGKVEKDKWTSIPMAARCGIHSIPFVVLIGKDGKVDSIHVRGSKLKARLTALLGEPITSEVPTDPTQPERPAKPANPAGGDVR